MRAVTPARSGGVTLPLRRCDLRVTILGRMGDRTLTLKEAAERVGVSPATLRRWADAGVIPEVDGTREWTEPAVAHARIVARLRERGHRLDQIREAGRQGRLAYRLNDAAAETGLEPALIERFWTSIGLPPSELESLTDEDLEALRYVSSVLAAGFPLVAFLQLCRVYGQSLSQIADAEVRLFHLYVHEPLMREGVPGLEMAEEMELEDDESAAGRVRVAIVFADLAGYTRFTEEEGEEEALSSVERFVERVTATLPEDARVVKTIGDEVMVVGTDVGALVDWAVGFLETVEERPEPRLGVNYGSTLYRDGDYFGREVNLASRVVARARGGEVLVTDSVVDAVSGASHLRFEPIGSVKLKGFDEPRQLCRAARS